MLMHFEAKYLAADRADVEARGLHLWRDFIGDAEASLHWSTSFIVQSSETSDDYTVFMTVKDNKDQQRT